MTSSSACKILKIGLVFPLISIWYSINIPIYLLHAIWIKFSLLLILILLKYVNQQTDTLFKAVFAHHIYYCLGQKENICIAKIPELWGNPEKSDIKLINLDELCNDHINCSCLDSAVPKIDIKSGQRPLKNMYLKGIDEFNWGRRRMLSQIELIPDAMPWKTL